MRVETFGLNEADDEFVGGEGIEDENGPSNTTMIPASSVGLK